MIWEIEIECFTIYTGDLTDMSFLFYHGSVQRNKGMEGNREIYVVIDGRITMGYLCFTYTPVSTVEFYFSLVEQ